MDVLTPTPCGNALRMERGGFLGWFTASTTIPSGQHDALADHLKNVIFSNPLGVLLQKGKPGPF
jgi:hypothetical protein